MIAQQTGFLHVLNAGHHRLFPVATVALLLGCCTVLPANASGKAPRAQQIQPAAQTAQMPAPGQVPAAAAKPGSCICRAQGIDHELGATICLRGPKGPRLAQCVMVLNNTSWKFSDAPCALAGSAPQVVQAGEETKPLVSLALWER